MKILNFALHECTSRTDLLNAMTYLLKCKENIIYNEK